MSKVKKLFKVSTSSDKDEVLYPLANCVWIIIPSVQCLKHEHSVVLSFCQYHH